MSPKFWLMKAEPDSRIVKGKDVKFSVDDFESAKITPWEGVRNAEARNLMKEMKVGDKVLFYHSNCKTPGIAAFAEVSKEAYPDYTAWDPSHPYYDTKTNKESPKWHMVDVSFVARAQNFIALALLREIAAGPTQPKEEIAYIGEEGVKAIKEMALVTRGRLSVQRVEEKTWTVIEMLAEKGGWELSSVGKSKGKSTKASQSAGKPAKARPRAAKRGKKAEGEEEEQEEDNEGTVEGVAEEKKETSKTTAGRKRKTKEDDEGGSLGLRRSTRARR